MIFLSSKNIKYLTLHGFFIAKEIQSEIRTEMKERKTKLGSVKILRQILDNTLKLLFCIISNIIQNVLHIFVLSLCMKYVAA